jgi:hypothetical protein
MKAGQSGQRFTTEQDDGSLTVSIDGTTLACVVCRNDRFHKRASQLPKQFGLDWLHSGTTNFVCTNCGYIFWFVQQQTVD